MAVVVQQDVPGLGSELLRPDAVDPFDLAYQELFHHQGVLGPLALRAVPGQPGGVFVAEAEDGGGSTPSRGVSAVTMSLNISTFLCAMRWASVNILWKNERSRSPHDRSYPHLISQAAPTARWPLMPMAVSLKVGEFVAEEPDGAYRPVAGSSFAWFWQTSGGGSWSEAGQSALGRDIQETLHQPAEKALLKKKLLSPGARGSQPVQPAELAKARERSGTPFDL